MVAVSILPGAVPPFIEERRLLPVDQSTTDFPVACQNSDGANLTTDKDGRRSLCCSWCQRTRLLFLIFHLYGG